jgi:hypothetical protein
MKVQSILLLLSLFFSLTSNCQSSEKQIIDNSFRDTNTYTILSFTQFKVFHFDSTFSDAALKSEEIKIIEQLYFKAIDDYNKRERKFIDSVYKNKDEKAEALRDFLIPISNTFFIKQLIPVINKKGEKEIYINCFKADPNSMEYFWKTDLIEVMDGGNDYFHLIINLDKLIFYNVRINAYG